MKATSKWFREKKEQTENATTISFKLTVTCSCSIHSEIYAFVDIQNLIQRFSSFICQFVFLIQNLSFNDGNLCV